MSKDLRRLPRPKPWPRCDVCGARFPAQEFLRLHLIRTCCGLPGKRGGT
jgi:hypothetical protein